MIQIGVISLFPEMFQIVFNYGIIGKAIRNGLITLKCWNPRKFTYNKHFNVDDRPYGGGLGMIMTVIPLKRAIHAAKNKIGEKAKVIYLSPQGRKLDQKGVSELANNKKMILVCGRYKGIDERLIDTEIDEEWSIGDYVLSGGELAAMILIDSISRYIPGVLSCVSSIKEDSFFKREILDCSYYTRPKILGKHEVPSVLLSGNHNKIRKWRLKESLGRTWIRRPDLLKSLTLTYEETMLLSEFQKEHNTKVIK